MKIIKKMICEKIFYFYDVFSKWKNSNSNSNYFIRWKSIKQGGGGHIKKYEIEWNNYLKFMMDSRQKKQTF